MRGKLAVDVALSSLEDLKMAYKIDYKFQYSIQLGDFGRAIALKVCVCMCEERRWWGVLALNNLEN